MHKLSCHDPLYAGRVFSLLTSGALRCTGGAWMLQRTCLGAECREKNRSRNSTRVPRAVAIVRELVTG
jgi:hypothetical protein